MGRVVWGSLHRIRVYLNRYKRKYIYIYIKNSVMYIVEMLHASSLEAKVPHQ